VRRGQWQPEHRKSSLSFKQPAPAKATGTIKAFCTLVGPMHKDLLPILHVRDRWLVLKMLHSPRSNTLSKFEFLSWLPLMGASKLQDLQMASLDRVCAITSHWNRHSCNTWPVSREYCRGAMHLVVFLSSRLHKSLDHLSTIRHLSSQE
jgi:hypothetical protein